MANSVSSLKGRIEACITKRAALEERKARAEKDLRVAEKALADLGLKPGAKAKAAIEEAEEELAAAVADVEKQLGIA